MGGPSQQQGDRIGALTAPAPTWHSARLRLGISVVLRCRGLSALAHVRHSFHTARLRRVQRVESMSYHPHWTAYPRPPGRKRVQQLTLCGLS